MKLGVITNGLSYDLEEALKVMQKYGLNQVELQFIGSKPDGEIGNQSIEEIYKVKNLVDNYDMQVCSLTRHLFSGKSINELNSDSEYIKEQMKYLEKLIQFADILGAPIIRTMSFCKVMVIEGQFGADEWNASNNSTWPKFLKLMEIPVRYAEDKGVVLAVETGNNAMITSGILVNKLIKDLASPNLKVMWDPANSLFCNDIPYPDAYNYVREHLAHIHMKDVKVDIPRAKISCCPLGEGDMAPYLEDIATALKKDNYEGVISFESVYKPEDGTYLDGFKSSVDTFKKIFG